MSLLTVLFSCNNNPHTFAVDEVLFSNCAQPVLPPGTFRDALPRSGVDFVHHSAPPAYTEESMSNVDPFQGSFGAGLVAADLDADGYIDLFYVQEVGANKLFWGNGDGTFASAEVPLAQAIARNDSIGISANTADYNGDGLLDLLVLGYNDIALYHNLGNRNFEDRSSTLALSPTVGYPGGAAWGDYDNDGDLDLFVCSYGRAEEVGENETEGPSVFPSMLYRNDGGHFTNRRNDLPIIAGQEGACLQGAFRDFDRDGDLDLLQVNDFGPWRGMTNFWENKGSSQEDWVWEDRYSTSGAGTLSFPMGSMYRDIDGDLQPDMWLSDIGKTSILKYLGSWEWMSMEAAWGHEIEDLSSDVSWSVLDIDLDGDGHPGVYIGYGPHLASAPPESWDEDYAADQPDRFLVNQTPTEKNPTFYLDNSVFPFPMIGNARGAATVDLNHDGVPDLVTSNLNAPPTILLGACTSFNRLVIQLRDTTTANTFGIGSVVQVRTTEKTQIQELSAGGRGTFSGEEPALFFGLGSVETIERVEIIWPDGEEQIFTPSCAHCRITLTRSR